MKKNYGYRRLYLFLDKKNKWSLFFITFLMFVSSALELASIGLLVPVMGIIVEPKDFDKEKYFLLNKLEPQELIWFTILIIVISYCVRFVIAYRQVIFTNNVGNFLATKLLAKTLSFSYYFFSSTGPSNAITTIQNRTASIIHETLFPFVNLIQALLTLTFIVTGMLIINFYIASIILSAVFICYITPYFIIRKKIEIVGNYINLLTTNLLKELNDMLSIFREIKIYRIAHIFVKRYSDEDQQNRKSHGLVFLFGIIPKFITEPVIFVLILYMTYISTLSATSDLFLFPQLVAIVVGLQKSLPQVQQLYTSITLLKAGFPQLEKVIYYLDNIDDNKTTHLTKVSSDFDVAFQNISYNFPNQKKIINGISLTILPGEKICIMGESGSGKSTLLNLILGMIKPKQGKIFVSKKRDNVAKNAEKIAFVGQDPFLISSSIKNNILLFSEDEKAYDVERMKKCYYASCLDLVFNNYEEGISQNVNERGENFSGGQKQRINIARCLYRNSDIIIFDEATSALDNSTTKKLISRIKGHYPQTSMIFVTHDETVTSSFDKTYTLKQGKIYEN